MVERIRVLGTLATAAAGIALTAGVALAYTGPKVPVGAAPAPTVGGGAIHNSAAPQPVKKMPATPGTSHTMTYSAPSANPNEPTLIKVQTLPNGFIQPGTITLTVSNAQNLATIQKAIGNSETVLTAFQLNSLARSREPMIVTVSSPGLIGKFSVFAIRHNGQGKPGYHLIYVGAKLLKNGGYQFVANRNEMYVLVLQS
jgi:hypothetical protein